MEKLHKFELDGEVVVKSTREKLTVNGITIVRDRQPVNCSVVYELYGETGRAGDFHESDLLGSAAEIEAFCDEQKAAMLKSFPSVKPKVKK